MSKFSWIMIFYKIIRHNILWFIFNKKVSDLVNITSCPICKTSGNKYFGQTKHNELN